MKEKLKLAEVWFKLVLFVFFILLYLLAIPYPEKSKQFPQLIAIFSLIMIVISLIMDFTRKGKVAEGIGDVDDTELKVLDNTTQKTKRESFYKAWGIIIVTTAIGFLGGFLFTTLYSLVLPYSLEEEKNYSKIFSSLFL